MCAARVHCLPPYEPDRSVCKDVLLGGRFAHVIISTQCQSLSHRRWHISVAAMSSTVPGRRPKPSSARLMSPTGLYASVLYGKRKAPVNPSMHYLNSVTWAVPYLSCHHGENSPCAPPWAIVCQAECRHSADVAVSFVLIVQGDLGKVLVLWAPCVIPQDDESAVLNEAGFLALEHARHLQASKAYARIVSFILAFSSCLLALPNAVICVYALCPLYISTPAMCL